MKAIRNVDLAVIVGVSGIQAMGLGGPKEKIHKRPYGIGEIDASVGVGVTPPELGTRREFPSDLESVCKPKVRFEKASWVRICGAGKAVAETELPTRAPTLVKRSFHLDRKQGIRTQSGHKMCIFRKTQGDTAVDIRLPITASRGPANHVNKGKLGTVPPESPF